MNGGAEEDISGAAINKVSEETQRESKRARGYCVCRMVFSHQCKSFKVKENVSGHILMQMCVSQMLAEKKKKRRAKFAPVRQWSGVSLSFIQFIFFYEFNA